MTAAAPLPSPFTLTPIGNRTNVGITGNLEMGNRQQLKQLLLDELLRGQKHVVVDLERCPYIDSCGLGVLVSIAKHAKNAGGTFRCANPNDDLRTLFELTGLATLFAIGGIAR